MKPLTIGLQIKSKHDFMKRDGVAPMVERFPHSYSDGLVLPSLFEPLLRFNTCYKIVKRFYNISIKASHRVLNCPSDGD